MYFVLAALSLWSKSVIFVSLVSCMLVCCLSLLLYQLVNQVVNNKFKFMFRTENTSILLISIK